MSHRKTWLLMCGLLLLLTSPSFAAGSSDPRKSDMASEETSCEEQAVMIVAQSGSAEEPASGDIQERAVPRLGPGAGAPPMTRFEGGVIEGNRLKANPGYTLQALPGGKVMLKPNGGGNAVEANCRCLKTGGCSVSVEGSLAQCVPSTTNGCKSSCLMVLGLQRSGGSMLMQ
jgi:hypothetical protein